MASVRVFLTAPSEEGLVQLTKKQLYQVSRHYNLPLGLPVIAKVAEIRGALQSKFYYFNGGR